MEQIKIIALKESVLEDNNADAQALREELRSRGTCLLNLMSSPGSRVTGNISTGRLNGIAGADVIEFCASDAQDDLLCADRIHLTEEGNAALAELLAQRLALPEE